MAHALKELEREKKPSTSLSGQKEILGIAILERDMIELCRYGAVIAP